jgi:hypothetical protein
LTSHGSNPTLRFVMEGSKILLLIGDLNENVNTMDSIKYLTKIEEFSVKLKD